MSGLDVVAHPTIQPRISCHLTFTGFFVTVWHMEAVLVESPPVASQQLPSKPRRPNGPPPKITRELIARVIDRRAVGMSLAVALGMEDPLVPMDHWNKTLEKTTILRAYAAQREGEAITTILRRMQEAKPGAWQRDAWILERQFGYAAPKSGTGTQVNVTVNTCIGLADDISKRAASIVLVKGQEERLERKPKPFPIAKP